MKMRHLIAFALLLTLPTYAVHVRQNMFDLVGGNFNESVRIKSQSNYVALAGGGLVPSNSKPFPIINGWLEISNLLSGRYDFSVGNLPTLTIVSTNDSPTVTNSIIEMALLATNRNLSFPTLSAPFVQRIIAGTNVTISPTNGLGAVTINASGSGGLASIPSAFTNSFIRTDSLTVVSNATFSTLNVTTLNATTLPSQIVTNGTSSIDFKDYAGNLWQIKTGGAGDGGIQIWDANGKIVSFADGDISASGGVYSTSWSVDQSGLFTGNGSGLTNLNATNIIGRISSNSLPTTIPASSVTGVLPAGTVAANSMAANTVLTSDGTNRLWSSSPVVTNLTVLGNLGIGTNAPAAKLHLRTDSGNVLRFNSGAANTTPNLIISTASAKACGLIVGGSGGGFLYDNQGFFNIASESKANMDGGSSGGGTTRFYIASDGKVGIGTSSPSEVLQVTGNQIISGTLTTTNGLITRSNVVIYASGAGETNRATIAGAIQFFACTNAASANLSEAYVQDEAGNETLISPHSMDGPATLYDSRDGMPEYVVRDINAYVTNGSVNFVNIRRMARITELNTRALLYLAGNKNASMSNALVRLQGMTPAERQVLTVETFAEYNARTGSKLEPKNWDQIEQQRQSAYDAERALAQTALAEAIAAGSTNLPTVPPALDIRRPKPSWMR